MMTKQKLQALCDRIEPIDAASAQAGQHALEDLARQYAAIRRTARPLVPKKAVLVFGADHGSADEGDGAPAQETTGQRLLHIASGRAAINAIARHAQAKVRVVDIGTKHPTLHETLFSARVAPGTQSFTRGPAMTDEQLLAALAIGIAHGRELIRGGWPLVGLGEVSNGNAPSASAIAGELADASADPLDVLAKVGGFEIAGLVGAVLAMASERGAIILDGFVTTVAAALATRLAPHARDYLFVSHLSSEPMHRELVHSLDKTPLLQLGTRAGEGTSAALAMPLFDAALKLQLELPAHQSSLL